MGRGVMQTINLDWQLLALKLRSVAPLSTISKRLGRNQEWLSTIARGDVAEPKFSDGIALLDYAHDKLPVNELRRCLR